MREHGRQSAVVEETLPQRRATFLRWSLPGSFTVDRALTWGVQGGSSILQQGLFAGAHFVTNILLARWLAPASYGTFALAYSAFLFLLSQYMALFFEPIVVYGAGRYARTFRSYTHILVSAHFLTLVPACLLIAASAPLVVRIYGAEFQTALLALSVAAPLMLLMWLFRAAYYAQINPGRGVLAGATYFCLLLFIVWLLHRAGSLSSATAMLGMGVGSLIVSAACFFDLSVSAQARVSTLQVAPRGVAADHWRYGRWASLTAVLIWIPGNIYYALLPARYGLESTASLRALMNLMYPLLHATIALILFVIPVLVRKRERDGIRSMKRGIVWLICGLIAVGVVYVSLLVSFRVPILHLLYGPEYGDFSATPVLFIGMLPITSGIAGLLGAALRSLERADLIFWSYAPATVVGLAAGVPITLRYGVPGAAFAIFLNDLPAIAVLAFCFARCGLRGEEGASRESLKELASKFPRGSEVAETEELGVPQV